MDKLTQGWWVSSHESGELARHFRHDISPSELGEGSLTVAVHYSALNYKDALALTGSPSVVRKPPLVPGIDIAGVVEDSVDHRVPVGTPVIITGYGYGENRHGGLATTLRCEPEHVVALPAGLSLRDAATFGTAGITAALALAALHQHGITPDSATLPIAVTGAAGGVGSFALALLARAGFRTVAITGRTHESDYLHQVGANEVMSREEFLPEEKRPLLPETFAGAIDQVGGDILSTLLSRTQSNGVVAACGLASSSDLPTTVLPFILRGISLVGINSVYQPLGVRDQLWNQLASHVTSLPLEHIRQEIALGDAGEMAPQVLAGLTRGRVVVAVAD